MSVEPATTTPRHRLLRQLFVPFVLFFLASTAWALTTPLAGSPDEPAHVIRAAAVAHGQLLPDGTDADGRGYFEVPSGLAGARDWEDCFAHKSTVGAACQIIPDGSDANARESTSAAYYNPLYYAVVGWPSLLTDDPQVMVYAMRVITAAVSAFLAALTFYFLTTIMGMQRAGIAIAAVMTPMVLFLSGAANPNAWEITGGTAMLAAVLSLGFRVDEREPDWPALATIGAAGVIVANTRGVSPLWVAVLGGIGLIAIAGPRLARLARRPGMWVALAVVALGIVVAAGWGLYAGAFALEGDYKGQDWTIGMVLDTMLRRTIFETGYVGVFGWTDTAAPLIAVVALGGLGIGIMVVALAVARGRTLWATVIMGVAWILLPALIQLMYVRTAGMIWQARYTMIVYAATIILAAVAASIRVRPMTSVDPVRVVWVLGAVVSAAHIYTFATVQLRYARGSAGTIWSLLADPQWSPPGGAPLWLALTAAVCITFTALIAFDARRTTRIDELSGAVTA